MRLKGNWEYFYKFNILEIIRNWIDRVKKYFDLERRFERIMVRKISIKKRENL